MFLVILIVSVRTSHRWKEIMGFELKILFAAPAELRPQAGVSCNVFWCPSDMATCWHVYGASRHWADAYAFLSSSYLTSRIHYIFNCSLPRVSSVPDQGARRLSLSWY